MAAYSLSLASSSPVVEGISSSCMRLMAGTVSLRVLSSGPAASVVSSLPWVVSSLGTLKPPGSSLLVAVLSRRPARKNEAMSAIPASSRTGLSTQRTIFFARDPCIAARDCNTGLACGSNPRLNAPPGGPPSPPTRSTSRRSWRGSCSRACATRRAARPPPPRRRSPRPRAPPPGPGAGGVGGVPVAEPVQREERHGRRHPAVAVRDHGRPPVLRHPGFPQLLCEFLVGEERAVRPEQAVGVQVPRP